MGKNVDDEMNRILRKPSHMYFQKYMRVSYLGYLLRPIKSLSMNRLESIINMELFQELSCFSSSQYPKRSFCKINPETLGQNET